MKNDLTTSSGCASTTHTPGKWEAFCVGSSSAGDDGVGVYEIVAGGHRRVAEYLTAADAALCAAAPDLLAVAQMVLDGATDSTPAALIALAEQAVAKATGAA
jgi:ParB-like chromosome segregation protein Spo0J